MHDTATWWVVFDRYGSYAGPVTYEAVTGTREDALRVAEEAAYKFAFVKPRKELGRQVLRQADDTWLVLVTQRNGDVIRSRISVAELVHDSVPSEQDDEPDDGEELYPSR